MTAFSFEASPVEVRANLQESFRDTWAWVSQPGNWWRADQRVEIAAEVRNATSCSLCKERKEALSPSMVQGEHDRVGSELPAVAVDAVHRLVTDATRLSKRWLEKSNADGLSNELYIELLGVTVCVYSIDRFHWAMGLPVEPLPSPTAGEPSGYRPASAKLDVAWVPMIPTNKATGEEADLWDGARSANVIRAMSLVPDCVRQLKKLSTTMYLPMHQVPDVTAPVDKAMSRAQMELVAGRVSAMNECFY